METQQTQQKVQLYDPNQYAFIGFFLSLVPVFIMSFSNSKVLSNGEVIRKKMKVFLILFIAMIVLDIGLLAWASYSVTQDLKDFIKVDPVRTFHALLQGSPALETVAPNIGNFARSILAYSQVIFIGVNIAILILVTRFTSKNEIPEYNAIKAKNGVYPKRLLLPVIAGIAFVVLLYKAEPLLTSFFINSFS